MKIQRIVQKIYKATVATLYKVLTIFSTVKPQKIVFYHYRKDELEGNLLQIYKEMTTTMPMNDYYVRQSSRKMGFGLFKELWMIRDASKIIIDDYFLTGYLIKPRRQSEIIQLWHAAGAFKKFGHSTKNTHFGPSDDYLSIIPIHSNYSKVYVSTPQSAIYFAEAFNMKVEDIYGLGIPRIEQLKEASTEPPMPLTTQQRQKQSVLFAPTYRAEKGHSESDLKWATEINAIIDEIPDHLLLIIIPHPYSKKEEWEKLMENDKIIIDFNHNVNDWMPYADCFVTDYSSAIFEYALFEKPLANYVPDLQQYMANRGLYRPIEDISDGAILTNRQQLVAWLSERKKGEKMDTSHMVQENIGNTEDVSQKIVQHIFATK
ncbi:CDP-glycerol glycerophosphotransferase family protein [Kurthia sibirica]|uniref:Ribitolphosphotransferase n=1 Tax=Kurthia sibirica TaxID=202750 RepID=A0A2U3AKZ1_9BACL|nr:CDP-glycerol glycerophosphotransferase family protein [Kurthia sibirica]PWI25205.1 ribitolphosphotransferase [Kurthia sibirica]GEK35189.1 hypothetical protein KSI01_27220 [Kurthia sibirica]